MSQRLGMADGRCFTVNTSAQLFNNYVMKGPQLFTKIQEKEQGKGNCNTCDNPLLKVPDIY